MGGAERWCVVTGGRGFAARHLVEMLIRYGMFHVRVVDLGPSIKLEPYEQKGTLAEALRSGVAQYASADLRNKAQVLKALQDVEVVFHMAAPDSSINNHQLHYSVNVEGTKNVIEACIEQKVKRLIYTSSPSVVFDGVHAIINGDESLPYPKKHNDTYSATKAEGEALVIKANGRDGLLTCCIRPSSIFGPGDRLLVPSLVDAARAGKSKAYFITNMEPIKFWEFVSLILEGLGYERPRIKIPAFVMMPIAHLVEWTYKLLAPYGMKVPQLTPSRIRLLSKSRTFNSSKAKDRLGYAPIVSLQEGLNKTIESYSDLRRDHHRIADTLLWKDKKQTLAVALVLIAFYYNFVASGDTFVTVISRLVLVAVVFLFIHGKLPQKILGYKIEKIPASSFHFSQEMSSQFAVSVASSWNETVNVLISLCKGRDWMLFLKVVFFLLIINFLGVVSLQSLFRIGIPILFVAFYVYEKKEQEIDALVLKVVSFGHKQKSGISIVK
ncbi:3-beta hydroxysteroid dehydrogenase/isomerase [Dillenia turbinata]|uniref:Reticulon-like protein n=1 Tax=Dillenia turbinata TaxID=194707 RepID=A0AAN8VC50_9MAGN